MYMPGLPTIFTPPIWPQTFPHLQQQFKICLEESSGSGPRHNLRDHGGHEAHHVQSRTRIRAHPLRMNAATYIKHTGCEAVFGVG